AYVLEPAGRAYRLLEMAEREGIGAKVSGGDGFSGLAERAVLTRELAERQRVEIEEQGLMGLFRDVELPLVDVLVEMERTGVKLDTERLGEISLKVEQRVGELEREVWELAGEEFTIGSPQQLGEVLFEKLGLSRKRRGKTGYSTDARVLHRRRRLRADLGRLLAGRAARAGAHLGRAGAEGHLRARGGCTRGHSRRDVRGGARGHRSWPPLQGEDDQLRDRVRAVGLRA